MVLSTRPLFAVYVMWHPSHADGREIADRLRTHYGRDPCNTVGEKHGVSVLERSDPVPGASTPLAIDWEGAEFTAVVVLAEAKLVDDPEWPGHVHDVAQAARTRGFSAGFFPVTIDRRGLELGFDQQALRWDQWEEQTDRHQRLTSDLTHEFCRMLRHRLGEFQQSDGRAALERYLEKIQVFISHSKHDDDGESVAHDIRDWIQGNSPLASFFDVYDIPPGLPFEEVLLHQIGAGAVMAVHTDSYSTREWCRREVIEAKRRLVPMLVVDCVRDVDPRGMPYLGNVPVVRMEPDRTDRIGTVAGCLLDEVFRTWLWLCRVGLHLADSPGVLFTARPPELITLAALTPGGEDSAPVIVYPDPLMRSDDQRLLSKIAPDVRVLTLTKWLEERR